jgi:exonuclease SbcC
MKVLAVRGRNLASLEREFAIDFTAEPLKSAGIFAITGSTGSGKSTLLDALCLALFDDAPRTSRVSENISVRDVGDKTINQRDSRTVLRRGAAEGYAEVEFVSLGGENFRARWSVRRARSKADGSMQSSEIRLYNLSTETEVPGGKTELLAKIAGLTGLSFDQFTRSVLLAQGDFATFLKARQAEKAELLEKLTGTEIYSRISVAIYEKARKAETEWFIVNERIKGTELLPEEEVSAYKTEKEAVRQDLSLLKKESESLSEQLKRIDEKERLSNAVKQAEADLSRAQKAIEEAGKRFAYILQLESVQDIRDTSGLLKNTGEQLAGYRKNLAASENRHREITQQLSDAKTALSECEKEREQLLEKQKEIAPQIIRARELDVRIKAAGANTGDAQKEYAAARTVFENTKRNLSAVGNTLQQTEKTFVSLREWFASNKNYECIAPRTELLVSLITDAQTARELREQNKKTLAANQSLLQENLKRLDALKRETERLNNLLPAEIAALRAGLTDGTPCPVCGSIHHPAAKVEDGQRMKEQELQQAKEANARQTDALADEVDRRKNEIIRLAAVIENYAAQYDRAYGSLEKNLPDLPGWKERFERAELKEYLRARTNQWSRNSDDFIKAQEQINRLRTTVENEEVKLKDASESLTAKTERLTGFQQLAGQLLTERAGALHGKPADAAEKYFIDKLNFITHKLKEATDHKNNLTAKQESLNGIIGQIRTTISQSGEKYRELQEEINTWIREKGGGITHEQLAGLLEKDTAWIRTEKQSLTVLTETETTARATLSERRKNLEQHSRLSVKPEYETASKASLQEQRAEKNELAEFRNRRMTEIEVILTTNAERKEQMKGLEKERKEKGASAENWKKLNVLLGSANGHKFKEIAQGYTLETLLSHANKHLQELSPRYRLQRIPDTLALQVIDTDMLNEIRTIHSLSGGESFLISLALALGLSSLSSNRMKVESLFIDEGFGSLDSDTLRIAMDALEHLHTQQGRKIGIISHVTEMTERIPVRINVSKISSGKSEITVTG